MKTKHHSQAARQQSPDCDGLLRIVTDSVGIRRDSAGFGGIQHPSQWDRSTTAGRAFVRNVADYVGIVTDSAGFGGIQHPSPWDRSTTAGRAFVRNVTDYVGIVTDSAAFGPRFSTLLPIVEVA